MRLHPLLLALTLALAMPSAAPACSLVIEGAARHRNYEPLSQRAQPILLPFDGACRSAPEPTAAEIRALVARSAPAEEVRRRAGLFARLAFMRGDTAGLKLAEPLLMKQFEAAPGRAPHRKCTSGFDCDRARAYELSSLKDAAAWLHLQLYVLTSERRWLDLAHAEVNAATEIEDPYEKYGVGLTGQTIRSYVYILDPQRPLYSPKAPPCPDEQPAICPMEFPFGDAGTPGWRDLMLATLEDPAADPEPLSDLHKPGIAQGVTHIVVWEARQATLSPTATTDDARKALVLVRNLSGLLKPNDDETHLLQLLTITEAQLLARIARNQPGSPEARNLIADVRPRLAAIAADKDQPALAWRAQRLLTAIDRRAYGLDLFVF